MAVHGTLSERPEARLEDVAQHFFEKVLGQKLSDEPVRVVEGDVALR